MSGSAVPAASAAPRELGLILAIAAAATGASAVEPHDWPTWWLEAGPVLIGAPILLATRRRFPLTRLLYWLLLAHALILLLGAHYTYARVPPGYWLQDWLELSRNHYDRLGHVAQGFVPAILVRELLLRLAGLRPGAWLFVLVTSVCLAFSAFYEMLEWWTALAVGEGATAFLATQGDVWDTQWDMFLALCGAVTAQLLLASLHDRQLGGLAAAR